MVKRQDQGKINVRLKQINHNHNQNYNSMGFDTIEINLVMILIVTPDCLHTVVKSVVDIVLLQYLRIIHALYCRIPVPALFTLHDLLSLV